MKVRLSKDYLRCQDYVFYKINGQIVEDSNTKLIIEGLMKKYKDRVEFVPVPCCNEWSSRIIELTVEEIKEYLKEEYSVHWEDFWKEFEKFL